MDNITTTNRTITLTEAEWIQIKNALRHHATTQEALGWAPTAETARKLAAKLEA